MSRPTDILDLGRFGLQSGEGRRLKLEVGVDALEYGGQRYGVEGSRLPVLLEVSRTTSGFSLRLRFEAALSGPCMRCLDDAGEAIAIDSWEFDQPGEGEELDSPYLQGDELDLHAWARDALALALPAQIVCREECLGLCAECGENLNEAGPGHTHEAAPDPRWAKLAELRLE